MGLNCRRRACPIGALWFAARRGHDDCVRLLLAAGADAYLPDQHGVARPCPRPASLLRVRSACCHAVSSEAARIPMGLRRIM